MTLLQQCFAHVYYMRPTVACKTTLIGAHTPHCDALKVPGELVVIIVVTVIAIIAAHHSHYQ